MLTRSYDVHRFGRCDKQRTNCDEFAERMAANEAPQPDVTAPRVDTKIRADLAMRRA